MVFISRSSRVCLKFLDRVPSEAYFASTAHCNESYFNHVEVNMKILGILFLAVLMNMGLAQDSEEDNSQDDSPYISYISVDFASAQIGDSVNKFDLPSFMGRSESTLNINNQDFFRNVAVNVGIELEELEASESIGLRFEISYRDMRFGMGNPTYFHADFIPQFLVDQINQNQIFQMNGDVKARAITMGIFADLNMGDSKNFTYLGSGFGPLTFTDQNKTTIGNLFSFSRSREGEVGFIVFVEAGIVARLGDRIGMRLGYEWIYTNDQSRSHSVWASNRHIVKFGLLYFFRKKE